MNPRIELHNVDCMEYLATCEDNAFELAIVDPPYGIGAGVDRTGGANKKNSMSVLKNTQKIYDDIKPTKKYFEELQRVAQSQIIWGGNYFGNMLPATRCLVVWDKMNYLPSMSQIEIAWTSKDQHSRLVKINSNQSDRTHISQKPVKLYEWLLMNYAKEGDRILDTHLGSGSIAIACHNLGFDLVGCELDTDYFNAAKKRLQQHQAQLRIPV